jgi:hypothetical protein
MFLHHINHPSSTTIPKLARARAGQLKIFERCRKKQIQRSASLQGFMKVLSWCPEPVNGRKCFLSTHGYKGIHCCISCCQMRHLRMTPTR